MLISHADSQYPRASRLEELSGWIQTPYQVSSNQRPCPAAAAAVEQYHKQKSAIATDKSSGVLGNSMFPHRYVLEPMLIQGQTGMHILGFKDNTCRGLEFTGLNSSPSQYHKLYASG